MQDETTTTPPVEPTEAPAEETPMTPPAEPTTPEAPATEGDQPQQ